MYFADDTHAPYALLHLILIASTLMGQIYREAHNAMLQYNYEGIFLRKVFYWLELHDERLEKFNESFRIFFVPLKQVIFRSFW